MISIDKNLIKIIPQKLLSDDDLIYIETLGGSFVNGQIEFDINKTSKVAMTHVLNKFASKIVSTKNKDTEEQRLKLFSYLSSYYSKLSTELDKYFQVIPYEAKLYAYQKEAIKFIIPRQFSLITPQQGTGKSIISVTADIILRAYKQGYNAGSTLVIAKPVAKHNMYYNWSDDWGIDKKNIFVIDAQTKGINYLALKRYKYIMINYDILDKYMNDLVQLNLSCVIFDESHKIKNTETAAWINSSHIVWEHLIKNPSLKVIMLTGTPITNWADDLIGYLKLFKMRLADNKSEFKKKYIKYTWINGQKKAVGTQMNDELAQLLSNIMFRIKHEGNTETKGKRFLKYAFDTKDVKEKIEDIWNSINPHDSVLSIENKILSINRITSLAKVDGSLELVKKLISKKKKVVIYSYFTDVIEKLKTEIGKLGVPVFVVDGRVKRHEDRVIAARAFNKHNGACVFIGQTVAGGESIDLQSSYDIILNDLPLTWAALEQVIYRLIRIGQKFRVNIYVALCKGTCDEKIAALVINKHRSSSDIIDAGAREVDSFNAEEAVIDGDEIEIIEKKVKEVVSQVSKEIGLDDLSNIEFVFKT